MHQSLRRGFSLFGSLLSFGSAFAAAPVFSRLDSIAVVLGDSVDYRAVASGEPTSFTAVGLPTGVTLNSSTGLLSGVPNEVGSYPVKITAANADGAVTGTLNISVVSPTAGPLIYAPLIFDAYRTPQQGGDWFTCALKATGSPTSFQTNETLPAQWTFTNGTFVGPTSQPGTHMIPVSATNAYGIGSAAITLRIHPACTELQQTTGTLRAGDVFTVTVQFNRAVTFNGAAPYLEFSTYPNGEIRKIPYVSGNGTATFQFAYRVTSSDTPGDILLFTTIKPSTSGGVDGLVDSDGLALGAALPIVGTYVPSANIAAQPSNGSSTVNLASTGSSTTGSSTSSATAPTTTSATASNASAPSVTESATPNLTPTGNASNAGLATATPTTATTPTTASTPTAPVVSSSGARLVNLSARASVSDGASDRSFIAGFVVSGSAPKRMLLRAIGPALSGFGVGEVVGNPLLRVYDGAGKVVSENDDWSGSDVSTTGTAVGAFGLSAGSRDAAMTVTLAPGNYSVQVVPNGGSGVAMAEIYDADGSSASAPLINISTRAFADSGEKALVAGFVISGSESKRVLIRGIGPALSAYGVAGVLSNPSVRVFHDSAVVAQNDDWQNDGNNGADVATAAKAVGAFDLAAGSRDAALVATLAPGAYSAVVSPASGSAGAGMVEVYELH